MIDLALLLLQQGTTANPLPIGVFRFFAAFALIMTFFLSFLGFTYWISKDEQEAFRHQASAIREGRGADRGPLAVRGGPKHEVALPARLANSAQARDAST